MDHPLHRHADTDTVTSTGTDTAQPTSTSIPIHTQPTSTSTSVPPPPVAQSPGPRATALATAYDLALTHTLRACSYANFAACFPTPATQRPETLRALWRQVVGKIEEKGRREFEAVLLERDVVAGLNRLEAVLEGGRARRESEMERERGEDGEGVGVGMGMEGQSVA